MSIGQELLDVPFGEMVVQLASAIAEGQYKMDKVSCEIAKMMGDPDQCSVEIPQFGTSLDGKQKVSLIGAGFQPTFYQFTDTIIEVKISIKITKSVEASMSAKFGCSVASVSASFSAKYSYSAEGSSLIRTKITPVPPSNFLQTVLDLKAKMEQKLFEKTFELIEKEVDEKINEKIQELSPQSGNGNAGGDGQKPAGGSSETQTDSKT